MTSEGLYQKVIDAGMERGNRPKIGSEIGQILLEDTVAEREIRPIWAEPRRLGPF